MLNMLKDPAKRAEWVYGQPMAPCPKCGSYNMKPQMPIALETTGEETMPQLVGKWARATKAGATPLQGPAYYEWRKRQNTISMVVEVANEKAEAVRAAIVAAGGKVVD